MRGFGFQMDTQTGFTRSWYVGADGVQRWASNDEPVNPEPPTLDGLGYENGGPVPDGPK
jgi:hypothetical protein